MSPLTKLYFLLIISIFITIGEVQAQKEANVWYFGRGVGLDFSFNPPSVLYDGAIETHEAAAAISDSKGNLLFYTNSEQVWTRNHEMMENGDNLAGNISARQGAIIFRDPANEKRFFLFTVPNSLQIEASNAGLNYHLIDMTANNGLGKVEEKNINLFKNSTEAISGVFRDCACTNEVRSWVVAARSDATNLIYAFEISPNGVTYDPVISELYNEGLIHFISISPDGKRLAYLELLSTTDSDVTYALWLTNFDVTTGKASDPVKLAEGDWNYFSTLAFSPNGKYLFIHTGTSGIHLFDVETLGLVTTKTTTGCYFCNMQLTPSRQIFIMNGDNNKIDWIKEPDLYGLDSIVSNYITFLSDTVNHFPRLTASFANFPSTYFYSGAVAEAGEDSVICSGEPMRLGGNSKGQQFEWSPSAHLSDPDAPNPVFSFENHSDSVRHFTYTLVASDDNCTRCDTVTIAVNPAPRKEIAGKSSVCPGSFQTYSIGNVPGYSYHWMVNGGAFVSSANSAQAEVKWGVTNDSASIEVVLNNEYGCPADTVFLPVRVNVELETETPRGDTEICEASLAGNIYQVYEARESVYTWTALGGNISAGQGTHQVTIDWQGAGTQRLWVQEQSITTDTTCFGRSEELLVEVVEDTITLALEYISVDTLQSSFIHGRWATNNTTRLNTPVTLWRAEEGGEWEMVRELSMDQKDFIDPFAEPSSTVYEYKVSAENWCGRLMESEIHRSMLLSFNKTPDESYTNLLYTPYIGWDAGLAGYGLYEQREFEQDFRLTEVNDPGQIEFYGIPGLDAFQYKFRIKAFNDDRAKFSWSNTVSVEFDHDVEAPNVFTPNGDGFNESFYIKKIHLFPENELWVFDRNGKNVFHTKNYEGEWTGGGLDPGVYFYALRLHRNMKTVSGWLHILK